MCKMLGLKRYQQAHVVAELSAPATVMAVDGFAQLFFESVQARAVAYASAELAACDVDSPLFIGAVTWRLPRLPIWARAGAGTADAGAAGDGRDVADVRGAGRPGGRAGIR